MAQDSSKQPIEINPLIDRYISQVIDEKYPGLSKDQKQSIKDSVIQKISTQVTIQKYREFIERLRFAKSETERSQIIYEFIKNFVQSDYQASVQNDEMSAPQGIIGAVTRRFQEYFRSGVAQSVSLDLPEETSVLSDVLETRFRSFLQKNSARSVTDPDFRSQAAVSLEQLRIYQTELLSELRSSKKYSTFNSASGEVDDFFTSLINLRIDSSVRDGLIVPHNVSDRKRLVKAILDKDKNTFHTYLSVGLNIPDIDEIFPSISRFEADLQMRPNGELEITGDPVLEYKKLIRKKYERDLNRSPRDTFTATQEAILNSMLIEMNISAKHMDSSSVDEIYDTSLEGTVEILEGLIKASENLDSGSREGITSEEPIGVEYLKKEHPSDRDTLQQTTITSQQLERIVNPSFDKILLNPNLTQEQKEKIKQARQQILSVGDLTFSDSSQLETFLNSLSNLDSSSLEQFGLSPEQVRNISSSFESITSIDTNISRDLKDGISESIGSFRSESKSESVSKIGFSLSGKHSTALFRESIDVLLTKSDLTFEQREALTKLKTEVSFDEDVFFATEEEMKRYISAVKNFETSTLNGLSSLSKGVIPVTQAVAQISDLKITYQKFSVNSTEMADALTFAISDTKKLTPEQKDKLINLRTKIIGINGRLNIIFSSESEKRNFLEGIRNLDSIGILKFVKFYTSTFELSELVRNIELAKGIVISSRLSQAQKLNRDETDDFLDFLSTNVLMKMLVFGPMLNNKFPKITGIYNTLKALREVGPVGEIDQKFISIFTNDYFAVNITDVFDMFEASKNITGYKSLGHEATSFLGNRLSFVNLKIETVLGFLDKIEKPGRFFKTLSIFGFKFGKYDKNTLMSGYSFQKKLVNKALLRDFKKIAEALKRKGNISDLISYFEKNAATPEQLALLTKKYFRSTSRAFSRIKFDLINYANSNSRYSWLVKKGLAIGEKYAPGLRKFATEIYQKTFKFINPAKILKFYAKDFNKLKSFAVSLAKNFNKLPAPARRVVGFAIKKLLLKSSVRIATLGAKLLVGATTGVGLLLLIPEVLDLAKFFMSDEFKRIAKKVLIGFFVFIAFFVLIIYSAFMIAISGITGSDTEREFRTEPTYGSTDAVTFEYTESYGTSVGSSLTTRNSGGTVWGPYGSERTWDNLKKSDFRNPNMRIGETNCRIVCNMMKAAAGLTPGNNGLMSRNPYFFNARIADHTDATVADKINNNSAGQEYFCNTMVYTVLRDIDTGLDVPPDNSKMFWGTTSSPFFRHFHGRTVNSPHGSIGGAPQTYKYIPLRNHGDAPSASNTSTPLCVAKEDVKAGDVLFFDRPHCVLSNTFNDADGGFGHVGMLMYVDTDARFLYTFEANNVKKKGAYPIAPCETEDRREGFILTDTTSDLKLCRAFSYTNIDANCLTSPSTSYNCTGIPLGTPGFQESSLGGSGSGVGTDY